MQNKSFKRSLITVALSRIISLASSVMVGFLLPKIFSVTDYGFYKIFTLYSVYTALLHFGFVDGLLLRIAGKDYSELDPLKMRSYTRFFLIFETVISFVMIVVGIIFTSGEVLFIMLMLAANMVFVNITTYYQFISQAVQRFREYSVKNILVSVAKIVFVAALFAMFFYGGVAISYRTYLIGLNVVDFSIMLWYIVFYREITFGKRIPFEKVKNDIFSIFETGIVLTLAYQASHLILALDRQFVNILFSTEVFAEYSFAYNIVSLISTMISSISIVLLPTLKKGTREFVITSYKSSATIVAIAASMGLLCYFPLAEFIKWFLPAYQASIQYISIVLAGLLFTSVITVVMFTVTKVLDMNMAFFKDSCIILVLGVLTNMIAYVLFQSPQAISYASLFVMVVWFLMTGQRLKKQTKVRVEKELMYLLIISVGFLITTAFIQKSVLGFLAYAIWASVWTIVFYKSMLQKVAKKAVQKFVHY